MISIKFQGWFQVRLATDPDPSDEPRGISGYMFALPNEPDLDRIIRFHNPLVKRSHTPNVGVYVSGLYNNNQPIDDHSILGSKFNLESDPKFFGFNSIIADDGEEPIAPFIISIGNGQFKLQRSILKGSMTYPFRDTLSQPIFGESADIYEKTSIWNFDEVIDNRVKALQDDLAITIDKMEKYCIIKRLEFLKSPSAKRFFSARMFWQLAYNSRIEKGGLAGNILAENIDNVIKIDNDYPWNMNFWMGAWDPDAQCGFVNGVLRIPFAKLV
ncbi:hypothetical protein [Muriicola sp. Z0-33]|uniref:hypothetical protein n=1 Tax=Muriicola sp. Z0-33 TaxID=2816957 RepID=UPI002238E466|nr:hypothetical protein [Muriicola sp. Z0-33]MCW5514732.1 hypothetical protein [Muriicola sp. Z0-33]